jgi:hypothetical protein
MYTGNYDVGLLGSGPVQFVLVENDMPAPSGVPCSEFCSDLVTGTSGGDLSLSWYGFVGSAKLKGGLDCRTGEFRAELVDGEYALLPGDPDASAQLLPPGELAGQLAGKLQGQAPVAITGTLHVRAALESDGTFTVQHAP